MAYFRGDIYIWEGEDGLHFWNRQGMDYWAETSWCCDENGARLPGYEEASGVSIPSEIVDQLAMMRLAEILAAETPEKLAQLIDQASKVGNFGSNCLALNAERLKAAFAALKLEHPSHL